jgi:hypothetical protein
MKLGIISDTHGHLDAQIHSLFDGVDRIIHAGDIGNEDIITELQVIAPVTAVRGNMDRYGKTATYQECVACTFDGIRFFIVHNLGTPQVVRKSLLHPIQSYSPHVIIFGHTHRPHVERSGQILYFNPGSSSQGRSGKGKSVGVIDTAHSQVIGKILSLES